MDELEGGGARVPHVAAAFALLASGSESVNGCSRSKRSAI